MQGDWIAGHGNEAEASRNVQGTNARIDNEVHYPPLNGEFKHNLEVFTKPRSLHLPPPDDDGASHHPLPRPTSPLLVYSLGKVDLVNGGEVRKYTFENFSIILKFKLNSHSFIIRVASRGPCSVIHPFGVGWKTNNWVYRLINILDFVDLRCWLAEKESTQDWVG